MGRKLLTIPSKGLLKIKVIFFYKQSKLLDFVSGTMTIKIV